MTKYPGEMKEGQHVRQGDLLIYRRDRIPSKADDAFSIVSRDIGLFPVDGTVIHEGEKTGHKHELKGNAQVYMFAEEVQDKAMMQKPQHKQIRNEELAPRWQNTHAFVELKEDQELVHPEHEGIFLLKGIYQVERQREYNETKPVVVED